MEAIDQAIKNFNYKITRLYYQLQLDIHLIWLVEISPVITDILCRL